VKSRKRRTDSLALLLRRFSAPTVVRQVDGSVGIGVERAISCISHGLKALLKELTLDLPGLPQVAAFMR